jgi:hypothetical protein
MSIVQQSIHYDGGWCVIHLQSLVNVFSSKMVQALASMTRSVKTTPTYFSASSRPIHSGGLAYSVPSTSQTQHPLASTRLVSKYPRAKVRIPVYLPLKFYLIRDDPPTFGRVV